jgi:hypothetical protein
MTAQELMNAAAVQARARMCGTWPTARWLAKQGVPLEEALRLLGLPVRWPGL